MVYDAECKVVSDPTKTDCLLLKDVGLQAAHRIRRESNT